MWTIPSNTVSSLPLSLGQQHGYVWHEQPVVNNDLPTSPLAASMRGNRGTLESPVEFTPTPPQRPPLTQLNVTNVGMQNSNNDGNDSKSAAGNHNDIPT